MTRPRWGFSLIEVVVVIAIVALLAGLLLSAVQQVRGAAARMQCQNHLRQLALGCHHYAAAKGQLPPGVVIGNGKPEQVPMFCSTWLVHILPYIEQSAVWEQVQAAYRADPSPFGSAHQAVAQVVIPVYGCPSDSRVSSPQVIPDSHLVKSLSSYLGVMGDNYASGDGVLYTDSQVKMVDIRDGTSQTLLIGERPPAANLTFGRWYNGRGQAFTGSLDAILGVREINLRPQGIPDCPRVVYRFEPGDFWDNCDVFHFWSPHSGGANFAWADGSVRWIPYSAARWMPALASRAGGEVVELPE
ncbi:DUF1559 domain-containing protein [Thermogemmata fonticola]|uniref:DUF1559 domain-containing protein n=1 Tax=Thermogemmata fonticola TaxID=2755323 RepID=A0A7V8VEQ8_9BACT|nr:DUF1559 domain-containing protein [Thermogemmata fonticola]MBA2226700.1 DUF1559 domain-containing protein [Thermogemmata fonticola]